MIAILALAATGCAGGSVSQSSPQQSTKPLIEGISPSKAAAGSAATSVQLSGSGFDGASVVLWNGAARPTQLKQTALVVTLSPGDLAKEGVDSLAVMNGSLVSNSVKFQITAAAQSTLKITTTSLPAGQENASYSAKLAASGGAPPYTWNIDSGNLPPGVSVATDSGALSGTPSASGTFPVTFRVHDSASPAASAQASLSFTVKDAATSTPSSGGTPGVYGPAIASDGLSNTVLGPYGYKLSYRLRLKHSGSLVEIRPYLIMDRSGYSSGNGGQVLVSVQRDDGSSAHLPDGKKLATALIASPLSAAVPARYFPELKLSPPVPVQAGGLYHIVFENPGASPAVNFVSVDSLYQQHPTTPGQPLASDLDCASLLFSAHSSSGSSWKPRPGYTPIVQLTYSDGASEGLGYIEGWTSAPASISAAAKVRETFTVSGSTKTASAVQVRLARISGSGDLTIRLEDAGGTSMEEDSVKGSSLQAGTYTWVGITFATARQLTAGKTYHLVLEAPSGAVYQTYPVRKGYFYGFSPSTYFADGHAEFTTGKSWAGWTQWDQSNRVDGDLQFYFRVQ